MDEFNNNDNNNNDNSQFTPPVPLYRRFLLCLRCLRHRRHRLPIRQKAAISTVSSPCYERAQCSRPEDHRRTRHCLDDTGDYQRCDLLLLRNRTFAGNTRTHIGSGCQKMPETGKRSGLLWPASSSPPYR